MITDHLQYSIFHRHQLRKLGLDGSMSFSNQGCVGGDVLIEELLVSLYQWIHDELDKHLIAEVVGWNFADFVGSSIEVELVQHELEECFGVHANFLGHIWNEAWQSEGPAVIA